MTKTAAIEKPDQQARALHESIVAELKWIEEAKREGKHRIARLGQLLIQMQQCDGWRALGHNSMERYIAEIVKPFQEIGRTQLFACKSAAERLLPHVKAEHIEEMGIGKAYALAQHVKQTGQRPAGELVEMARRQDKTEADLKTEIARREHPKGAPEPEKGRWFEIGFYAGKGEREEIERAIELAKRTDPLIPESDSESAQNREVMLRFAREYLASYEDGEGVRLGVGRRGKERP